MKKIKIEIGENLTMVLLSPHFLIIFLFFVMMMMVIFGNWNKMAKRKSMRKRKCPGTKIRSKGKGRGLGLGKGKGPIGIPRGAKRRYKR